MATAKHQIRRRIGRAVGDLLVVPVSGGETGVLESTRVLGLNVADTTLLESTQGVVTGAASIENLFHRFVVESNDRDLRAMNISPALPSTPSDGDVAELYNMRGQGYLLEEYDDAIDMAFSTIERHALIEGTLAFPLGDPLRTWTYDDPAIRGLPESVAGVWAVFYTRPGNTTPIEAPPTWDLRGRDIVLPWDLAWSAYEGDVSIGIYERPLPLSSDDAITSIDPEYLLSEAAMWLMLNGGPRAEEPDAIERRIQLMQSRANAKRPMAAANLRPNTRLFE